MRVWSHEDEGTFSPYDVDPGVRMASPRRLGSGVAPPCRDSARPRRIVLRSPIEVVKAFIDQHRETYGVEPICTGLPIAASTYRRQAGRQADPTRRSDQAQRDEPLREETQRAWEEEDLQVYGADKVWRQRQREGEQVARGPVERRRLEPIGSIPPAEAETTQCHRVIEPAMAT